MRTSNQGYAVIQDYQTGVQKPLTLAEYRELKRSYISYHLEDCIGENSLFRFSAKDDTDAIDCVNFLNWKGMYKLKRIDPNQENGYSLVGIFHNNIWIPNR